MKHLDRSLLSWRLLIHLDWLQGDLLYLCGNLRNVGFRDVLVIPAFGFFFLPHNNLLLVMLLRHILLDVPFWFFCLEVSLLMEYFSRVGLMHNLRLISVRFLWYLFRLLLLMEFFHGLFPWLLVGKVYLLCLVVRLGVV